MGREVLKSAKLDVGDAQFIPSPTAGRLPGLIAGQIDGVALHPEDVFLAQQQKSTLHPLVQLVELMPLYMFNAYGASTEWIAKDRAAAARHRRRHDRGQPHDLPRQGQGRADHGGGDREAKGRGRVRLESNTKTACGRSTPGFDRKHEWSIDNSVENGDIEAGKKPSVEQVANTKLAEEAMELAGGRVTIGNARNELGLTARRTRSVRS